MAQYTVRQNQSIFDIAVHLYGSVEGIIDLLITNPWLSMDSDLAPGQSLEYHSDFVINRSIVEELELQGIVPGNGERRVYAKRPSSPYVMAAMIDVPANSQSLSFAVAGEGEMMVDWGDNSPLETIALGLEPKKHSHYFDNEADKRKIKIYGVPCSDSDCCEYHVPGHMGFNLTHLDVSGADGFLALARPIIVDRFASRSNRCNLSSLFLFEGTHFVDLRGSAVASLLPLVNLENLQELHLENVSLPSPSVLDEYLQALVSTPSSTGTRMGCKVYLTSEPTEAGYRAIETLMTEEEWNEPFPWEFYFNGTKYEIPT